MNQESMMKRVQMLAFALLDVGLFLDTHPYDETALQFYDKHRALYTTAVAEYEAQFGSMTMNRVDIEDGWSWIDHPWPWEMEE